MRAPASRSKIPSSGAGLPVRHALVLLVARLRPALVDPHPPTAQLDVVALVEPVGRLGGGDVGNHQQPLAQPRRDEFGGLAGGALLVAEHAAAFGELRGRLVVAGAPRRGHAAREFLDLGAQRLGLLEQVAVLDVEAHDLVDVTGRDAPAHRATLTLLGSRGAAGRGRSRDPAYRGASRLRVSR